MVSALHRNCELQLRYTTDTLSITDWASKPTLRVWRFSHWWSEAAPHIQRPRRHGYPSRSLLCMPAERHVHPHFKETKKSSRWLELMPFRWSALTRPVPCASFRQTGARSVPLQDWGSHSIHFQSQNWGSFSWNVAPNPSHDRSEVQYNLWTCYI